MPERIDHIIVAAADLAAIEASFTRLGFHVVGGGTHPHLGTRNRIIVLDQGYFELLAIADEETVSPAVRDRVRSAPGWIGFALQSADIAREAAAMRTRGADLRGPTPGRLVAPSGTARSWRTVVVGGDDLFNNAEPVPFLIQHDSIGEQHQRELAGADTIAPHANGAGRLQLVVIAVTDLASSYEAIARTYDFKAPGSARECASFNAMGMSLPFDAVDERISLVQPLGAGIAAERLASAGEGVCCVTVTVTNLPATRSYLENAGVAFSVWDGGALFIPAEATGGAPLAFVANGQQVI